MKRKDYLVLFVILASAGILFLLSRGSLLHTISSTNAGTAVLPQTTDLLQGSAVSPEDHSQTGTDSPAVTLPPADSYLLITVGDTIFEPYPLLQEQDIPITQIDGKQNVVHVSPDGFYMSSSTCTNQDCVHQGEVTIKNRDQRLLFNQVVCLPNQVMLELLTPEEAVVVWGNKHEMEK